MHGELNEGVRPSALYTVQHACDDWLRDGLDGRSAKAVRDATDALKPILAVVGHKPLRKPPGR